MNGLNQVLKIFILSSTIQYSRDVCHIVVKPRSCRLFRDLGGCLVFVICHELYHTIWKHHPFCKLDLLQTLQKSSPERHNKPDLP